MKYDASNPEIPENLSLPSAGLVMVDQSIFSRVKRWLPGKPFRGAL
ncbi:hypothetical protein [Planococcus beigongshangi]|nr:hypothetical protein [Planococcus beigongshangi]